MLVQTIIVGISRNDDGSFRVQVRSIADPSIQFQITLAAGLAQQAYIGRAVDVTLAFA